VANESLSSEHRRYLLIGFCLIPAFMNLAINWLIGWLMFRGKSIVPLWALESIGGDTLVTCFMLPAITCLIVTPIVRRHVRIGMVEPVDGSVAIPAWLGFAHRPLLRRAILFGLVPLVVFGGALAVVFPILGVSELAFQPFLTFKAGFSAVLGALVTPLIALLALCDPLPAVA
jgi:hypothetical protein